jgi:sulfur carrier protein ThiS
MYTGFSINILNGIYIMTKKETKKTKRIGLSITGVTPELKQEYSRLAEAKNTTHLELLKLLIDNFKHFNIELEEQEAVTIKQALRIAPTAYNKKIKKAVLRCALGVIDSGITDSNIDINKPNSARSADKRVDDLLESVFIQNEKAIYKYDKIFISKSSLLDFISKAKESGAIEFTTSKAVIDRCLERHRKLIEAHHAEQELDSNHNSKAYYERLKAANATNTKTEL